MLRNAWFAGIAVACGTALAGCNAVTASNEPPPSAAVPPPQEATLASLPDGAPCSTKIRRYRSVLSADYASGNVDPSVYEQISKEISSAATACSAGRNGDSMALLRSSEERHGYHV